jgi:hypothetical protein
MKSNHLAILSAVLLTAVVSISCYGTSRTVSALKFEPDILPASQMGALYEAEIRVIKNNTPVGEFSISKGALPAGMELVRVKGEDTAKISGIPEEVGTFTFTVNVWCYGTSVNGQMGEKEYSIVVEK